MVKQTGVPKTLMAGFTPTTDLERGQQFKDWLRHIKQWSYWDFVKATGFGYQTMIKWTQGKIPRPGTLELMKIKIPECPILKWKP